MNQITPSCYKILLPIDYLHLATLIGVIILQMDLKKRLELGQARKQTDEIVDYVGGRPARFKLLVEVYLNGPYRVTQRAAAPLSICVERWPYLIDPHLKQLITFVKKTGVHNAVIRNTIRLMQFVPIPRRHQGAIADLCFYYIKNRKTPVAIRVFSITVLRNIAMDNSDMKKELKLILEDEIPFSSAAFASRGLKVLKTLG